MQNKETKQEQLSFHTENFRKDPDVHLYLCV